jgi:hypothetical protein
MANYPAALPSSSPADHGVVKGEVIAIATELGTDPSGSLATVKDRLTALRRLVPDTSKFYPQPGARTTGVPVLNTMYLYPVWLPSGTLDSIATRCTTALATAVHRLGIYQLPTSGAVDAATLLIDAGTVDCSTTGAKLVTISQAVVEGWHLLAGVSQVAAATLNTYATTTIPDAIGLNSDLASSLNCYTVAAVSGALPATTTGAAGTSSAVVPALYVSYA